MLILPEPDDEGRKIIICKMGMESYI